MTNFNDEHYHWDPFWYPFGRFIWGNLFRRYNRLKLIGLENVPRKGGPAVIASNHLSMLDPFLVGYTINTPHSIAFMGKAELFKIKPLKFLLERWSAFPVDRSKKDAASMRTALNIIKEGEILGMFPEGTRSASGEMDELRTGAIRIALRTKAPLIPAGIWGTDKSLPRGGRFPQPAKVGVAYGPPLKLDHLYDKRPTPEQIAEVSEELRQTMQDLVDQVEAAWTGKKSTHPAPQRPATKIAHD